MTPQDQRLFRAAEQVRPDAMREALEQGADPLLVDSQNKRPLNVLAQSKTGAGQDMRACLEILMAAGAHPMDEAPGGPNALRSATRAINLVALRHFLDQGCPVSGLLGQVATYHGDARCALLLLERGADPDEVDASHMTPSARAHNAWGGPRREFLALLEGAQIGKNLPGRARQRRDPRL